MNRAMSAQGWIGWTGRVGGRALIRLGALGLPLAAMSLVGCAPTPRVLLPDEQRTIDRALVEYPAGYELHRYVTGLSAPTAFVIDADGSKLVAQGGRGEEPQIWRFPSDGGRPTLLYPHNDQLLPLPLPSNGWKMYGPIGGMVVFDGKVIVTHRDENDMGVVTALDCKGGHTTICAGFPAQADHGLTDLAIDPRTGRIWFACGTLTNSGVVGLDNFWWVRAHPEAHDIPYRDIELLGYKFQTANPNASIFNPAIAVTAPFQYFGQSSEIRVKASPDGKPSGAIYSVAVTGGFATVEAFGVHDPRGIAFDEFGAPHITNNGMLPIGTRPVLNDPAVLLRVPPGVPWLGWPDYSTTFEQISAAKYQPPAYMMTAGYPEVRPLIDLHASNLTPPVREAMLEAAMPSLCGAEKLAFIPSNGPFSKEYAGNVIIAESGDMSPYSSGGIALPHPVGFKVVRVDLDRHVVRDFVRNVGDLPGSKIDAGNRSLIERPIDVKFGPDGSLYILDQGRIETKDGQQRYEENTGQIFRLVPVKKTAAPEK